MPHVDLFDARKQCLEPLPERARHTRTWHLLETYSSLAPEAIGDHLRAVRDKAYAAAPYGCLACWRFLDLPLAASPLYPVLLARVRASAVLLDLGCGLGQVLRQLAVDGCPPGRLIGLDASRALVDLGFELFRDRARPAGAPRFVVADVLAAPPPSKSAPGAAALRALDGAVDIVHAASFFHLFGWAEQLAIGVRLVAMFRRPGLGRGGSAVLVGRDLGERCPLDPAVHGPGRYRHSPASLQRLWDAIGEKTRTVWLVRAEMEDGAPSLESLERVTTITYVVARLR